ncbi:hypothetical protein EVAR_17696_1 [Eumeta japonica]|uniref:Uncharacterized protein n=1 Tax=Eumeta variegata TaxID=151549 RepID=A0A4C1URS7_EUMVA|nr:hypothetical protein EVAR_17696_1 [Eumeta japonica]
MYRVLCRVRADPAVDSGRGSHIQVITVFSGPEHVSSQRGHFKIAPLALCPGEHAKPWTLVNVVTASVTSVVDGPQDELRQREGLKD